MNHNYDLVILGSGSTAFAAALAAQEMGYTAVMTEERTYWWNLREPRLSAVKEPDRSGKAAARRPATWQHAGNRQWPGASPMMHKFKNAILCMTSPLAAIRGEPQSKRVILDAARNPNELSILSLSNTLDAYCHRQPIRHVSARRQIFGVQKRCR